MKSTSAFLVVLLLLLISSIAFAWPGRVVGVSDGDTITVLRPGNEQVKIRLYGIDAPESAQPYGKASKANLSSLVFGKTVEIDPTDTDRYGRTVARVIVGSVDANAEQIRAGYAWLYRQYCTGPMCSQWAALEQSARSSRLGLWSDKSPIAPWDWRKGVKTGSNSEPDQDSGSFHGNVESQVFHRPGCKHYDCKQCVQQFSSRQAAISAGYRPCGICKP